jgi:hypothetical protein
MSRFARRVRRRRRNSLRRPRFDYTSAGGYFVTMNTWKRLKVFGNIQRGRMIPSALGRVVWDCWRAIPDHFDHVRLGAMVVMPDHVHAIIHIVDSRGPDLAREVASVGATHASPLLDVASRVGEVASREVARVGATHASPLLDVASPVLDVASRVGDVASREVARVGATHASPVLDVASCVGEVASREVARVGATHASPVLDVASRVGEVASREVARVGATHASPVLDVASCVGEVVSRVVAQAGGRGAPGGSLGAVVGAWKAASARLVNLARGTPGAPLWHRGYHDRIIRDEWALRCITRYIIRNPERWERDRRRPKP